MPDLIAENLMNFTKKDMRKVTDKSGNNDSIIEIDKDMSEVADKSGSSDDVVEIDKHNNDDFVIKISDVRTENTLFDNNTPAVTSAVDNNTPTVSSGADKNAPTVSMGVDNNAPAVSSGADNSAPTVSSGADNNAPTVTSGVDNNAPAVSSGVDSNASAESAVTPPQSPEDPATPELPKGCSITLESPDGPITIVANTTDSDEVVNGEASEEQSKENWVLN